MDNIFATSREYPVQPGCRYAVAFIALLATDVSLAWLSAPAAAPVNYFTLADGTTTEAYTLLLDGSIGWEIVAPSSTLYVYATSSASVSITKIQD